MARAGVTYLEVAKAAQNIQQQGQNPTVDRVLAQLGTGSKSTLGPLLKRWKSEKGGNMDTGGLPDGIVEAVKAVHGRLQQIADDKIKQVEEACASTVTEQLTKTKEAQRASEQLELNNQTLEKRLGAQQSDNNELRTELGDAHIKMAKREETLSHTTAQLSDTKTTLEEQKQENKQIRAHFEHYQTSVADDRQQAREQSHAIKVQLEARIQEHAQQLKHDAMRYQQLDAEKRQSEQSLTQQREEYTQIKQQHQTLELEAQQDKASIIHLKAEAKSLDQERIASKKHQQTAAKQTLELTAAVQGLEQEVTRLNQQLSEATDTVIQLTDKVTQLTDKNNFISQEKANLQGQLKQLERHR